MTTRPPMGPFPFTALPRRPTMHWPDGGRVAFWIIPNVEVFMFDYPMPGEENQRPDPARFRYPHVRQWSQREYGNRAGIWRLMEVMSKHGMPGTVALNSWVCRYRPDVVRAAVAVSLARHDAAHLHRRRGRDWRRHARELVEGID